MKTLTKILYIDDDNENLIGFETSLSFEYDIITTSEISEIEDILQNNSIQVILLDYKMHEKNGIDVVEQLFKCYPEIVYIITSAYADIDIITEAQKRKEIFDFIPKPWNYNTLKLTLKNAAEFQRIQLDNK